MPTREYRIKIVGAQYAANPDYLYGDQETEEMWTRTIGLLTDLQKMRPRVVLKAEPTNPKDEKAVMARAKGRKIGYVSSHQRDLVQSVLSQTDCGMVMAEVNEVVIDKHGFLFVILKCEEDVKPRIEDTRIDWSICEKDIPLLSPTEGMQAEDEAAFVLEKELLPKLAAVDLDELKEYLDLWIQNSRHDVSSEANMKRMLFIELLENDERQEVRQMADLLKHQRTGMCSHKSIEERTRTWWYELVGSAEATSLWNRWYNYVGGDYKSGLIKIDDILGQLPGRLYYDIGHLDLFFSRLYYMNVPSKALKSIISMLIIREKTCRKLKIDMKPLIADDYQKSVSSSDLLTMEEMTKLFLKFPTKIALGLYGGASTLLAGHPAWQKSAPDIKEKILSKEELLEARQEKLMDNMEKAAQKTTIQNNVYPQAGSTANVGCKLQSPEFKVLPNNHNQDKTLE